ncbi:ABC transporter substrate-binding protein [Actinopolymorpha pittospori]|uniref:Peptide/nickel transport system substrate-binding protein n=1 Tax=Actinopolymorpha pittospori TaxID=648752 RepID=A0A927MTT6_9ACTN|nr:peptide/nickel transport system substrate-binding protein [Actinopolymorpha pittospori]
MSPNILFAPDVGVNGCALNGEHLEVGVMESAKKKYENVEDVIRYQLMNRRDALRTGLGAGAAVLFGGGLLGACSSGGGSYSGEGRNAPEGGEEPVVGRANIPTPRDQTLVIGQVDYQVFNSFNIRIPNGVQSGNGFDVMVREYLFYLNLPTGELIPWLATGYEYNADHTTLTFTFDSNAKWSDGQPFTSKDFKFTVDLMRDHSELLGGGGDLKDFVKNVSTPDAQTATLELTRANPRLHYGFICTIASGFDVLPEHVWADKDPTNFRDNPPVRTGPYMLDRAIASQKMFVWKKNPNYWNKEKLDPKPNYVIYQSTAQSQDAASQAFRRAEFDVGSLDEEHAKALRSQSYQNLITTPFHDPCPRALWLNCDPARGIIGDPRMHWVISYVIDRAKVGTTVWPVKTPAAQYPWADYDGNDKWEIAEVASQYKMEYDPARAASLLDEMGATKGSDGKRMWKGKQASIEIITPSTVDGAEFVIGQLIVGELKKLGLAANIRSYSGSVHSEKWERGEFDISSQWVCNVSWDPNQLYTSLQTRYAKKIGTNAVGRNQVRLRSPRLDQLSSQLDGMDPASPQAKQPLQQALAEYYRTLPVIPVIQTAYPAYYNTTYWKGWPTEDDLYQVPNNWWGQFMFVIGKLEPTGRK